MWNSDFYLPGRFGPSWERWSHFQLYELMIFWEGLQLWLIKKTWWKRDEMWLSIKKRDEMWLSIKQKSNRNWVAFHELLLKMGKRFTPKNPKFNATNHSPFPNPWRSRDPSLHPLENTEGCLAVTCSDQTFHQSFKDLYRKCSLRSVVLKMWMEVGFVNVAKASQLN